MVKQAIIKFCYKAVEEKMLKMYISSKSSGFYTRLGKTLLLKKNEFYSKHLDLAHFSDKFIL